VVFDRRSATHTTLKSPTPDISVDHLPAGFLPIAAPRKLHK
jgi:hypothetical protein